MKISSHRDEKDRLVYDVSGDLDANHLFEPSYSTAYYPGIGDPKEGGSKASLHVRWHFDGSMSHAIFDNPSAAAAKLREMAQHMRTLAAGYEAWAHRQAFKESVQPLPPEGKDVWA